MEEEEEYFDRNVLWKFCFEVIIFMEEEIVQLEDGCGEFV